MSENYIVINGKKSELTEEQLKALGIEEEIISPFSRQKCEDYCFINETGDVASDKDTLHYLDDSRYSIANYCTDVSLMKQRALHEILSRLLWRFSCQSGELNRKWDGFVNHYHISVDTFNNLCITAEKENAYKSINEIYFPNHKIAEQAVQEIILPFMEEHPEFVW